MASTYLTRTPSSAGNRKTFAISFWVKRSGLSANQNIFAATNDASSSNARFYVLFGGGDTLTFKQYDGSNTNFELTTNRVFRDINAWYHIFYVFNSYDGTADNRQRIWINGVEETSFSTRTNPSGNADSFVNQTKPHNIGNDTNVGSRFFDGSISHFHLIDGTAPAYTEFGSTDSTTGEWKIKTPTPESDVYYGTNGFFILKDGNSVTDQSGKGNNWTVGGGTLTKTEDCPSNVFCTINPLYRMDLSNNATLSNGNNTFSSDQSGYNIRYGTLGASKGKFYYECKFISFSPETSPGMPFGISASQIPSGAQNGGYAQYDYSYNYDGSNGTVQYNGVGGQNAVNYGTTPLNAVGQIGMCAFDLDNNKLYFGVNGVWANSGNPAGNANGFSIVDPDSTELGIYFPSTADRSSARSYVYSFNFGNGYFGTTAVSSAGTNASNNGIFEYAVPSGFTALSTKGLNT